MQLPRGIRESAHENKLGKKIKKKKQELAGEIVIETQLLGSVSWSHILESTVHTAIIIR